MQCYCCGMTMLRVLINKKNFNSVFNIFCQVQGRLNEFLKLNNSKNICDSQKIKPLGKLRRSKLTMKRTYSGKFCRKTQKVKVYGKRTFSGKFCRKTQKVQVFRKKRTYSGKFCRKTLKVKVYEKKELSQVNFV